MADRATGDSATGRAAALTVLLCLTVVGEFALLEEVGPGSLAVGLLLAGAGGFFLTGVVSGSRGYVAVAFPWIGYFLLAPLSLLGAADGPWTSDGQSALVPLFLSLYATVLVAAGHGMRLLWLGVRRLRLGIRRRRHG